VVKHGDYDGALFLIDKQGAIREYLGGAYVLSVDHKFLFSVYYTDDSGIEVIDLTSGSSLFREFSFPYPRQWYSLEGWYFFVSENSPDSLFSWDPLKRVFQIAKIDSANLQKANKLQWSFLPPDHNDCNCNK